MRSTNEIFEHQFTDSEFNEIRKTKQPCVAAAVSRLTGSPLDLANIGTGFALSTRTAGYDALRRHNIHMNKVHAITDGHVYWVEYALSHVLIVDTRSDWNAIGITKRYELQQLSETVCIVYELSDARQALNVVCEPLDPAAHCLTLSRELMSLQSKIALSALGGFVVGAITIMTFG